MHISGDVKLSIWLLKQKHNVGAVWCGLLWSSGVQVLTAVVAFIIYQNIHEAPFEGITKKSILWMQTKPIIQPKVFYFSMRGFTPHNALACVGRLRSRTQHKHYHHAFTAMGAFMNTLPLDQIIMC